MSNPTRHCRSYLIAGCSALALAAFLPAQALAGGGSCGFQYNVQASQDVLLADKSTTKVEELASEI